MERGKHESGVVLLPLWRGVSLSGSPPGGDPSARKLGVLIVNHLDLKSLRSALWNAGIRGEEQQADGALLCWSRIASGDPVRAAVWATVRDCIAGRPAVNQADYLRAGACSSGRGVGNYRDPDGSKVSYRPIDPSEVRHQESESRELAPWVSAALSELQAGAVSV